MLLIHLDPVFCQGLDQDRQAVNLGCGLATGTFKVEPKDNLDGIDLDDLRQGDNVLYVPAFENQGGDNLT